MNLWPCVVRCARRHVAPPPLCLREIEASSTPPRGHELENEPDRGHFGAIGEFVVKMPDYLDWDRFALGHGEPHQLPKRPRPSP
jgi:hypothetical protein